MKRVSAAQFKNGCLAVLAEVERTRSPIVVTRRGKPMAKIAPITESHVKNPLRDSIELEEDIVSPVGDDWQVQR